MAPQARHCRINGQSLAEYTLIGSLIALACVAGVMVLGRNINDTLAGLKNDMHSNIAAAKLANGQAGGGSQTVAGDAVTPSALNCASTNSCPTHDDSLPMQQQQVSAATSGSLGDQVMQKTQAQQIIQQIASQLAINPEHAELADLLTELALAGHELADKQSSLAKQCPAGKNCKIDKLDKMNANFEKQASMVENYLASHPDSLPADIQQQLASATETIQADSSTFDPYAATATTTSQKTKKKSNQVCESGGDTTQCVQPVVTTTAEPAAAETTSGI